MTVEAIFNSIIAMDEEAVLNHTSAEIEKGTDLNIILNDGLISAMDRVGDLFSSGEIFVPEMLMAAEAMKSGLALIKPLLTEENCESKGVVLIGTVKGDLHDIGKNLVVMMLESAGFEVVDLGVDVNTETFVNAAIEKKPPIVALSALLTTTMPSMQSIVRAFKEQKLPVSIIVGGAPVTQDFADKIGADGYSDDAPGAVKLVKQLLSGR